MPGLTATFTYSDPGPASLQCLTMALAFSRSSFDVSAKVKDDGGDGGDIEEVVEEVVDDDMRVEDVKLSESLFMVSSWNIFHSIPSGRP